MITEKDKQDCEAYLQKQGDINAMVQKAYLSACEVKNKEIAELKKAIELLNRIREEEWKHEI